mgnify:CR=1 FL=1
MGRPDVRKALIAMESSDDIRSQLAAGNFGAVDGLDLSADEQSLVRDAASDMPEVALFAADTFLKLGDIKGESIDNKHRDLIDFITTSPAKWQGAVKYGWKLSG